MPYIGRSSNFGVRTRFLYTATASQTTFSGTDTQNLTLSYSDSNFIDVHQNGVLLKVVDDYTATSGTSVVLATGATASDVIEITVYDVFSIANHIKKTGDAMAGALTNIDIDGTELVLDADGDTSITADTDDQIDLRIGGADDFAFKANTFEVQTGSNIDMNGTELILDADGDTSITADTDDQIDIKVGGTDLVHAITTGLGVGTSSPFSINQILNTGWSSGAPYGTVLTVTGNNTNDANWGHLLVSDSTTSTGSGGSLRFAVGSTASDLSPHSGIDGYTEGSNYGGLKFFTRPNGGTSTERMKIDSTGEVTITDGDLVIGTSGHGISFAATSDGSGTDSSELLDDYEEGTWTPAMNSGGSTLGIIADSAIYTKIGRFVHVQVYATSLASTTSSGFRISGLPYTNLSSGQTVGSIMYQNIDIPGSRTQMVAYAPSSSDIIRLYGVGDNTTWQEITGTNTGTSFNMIINLQYTT